MTSAKQLRLKWLLQKHVPFQHERVNRYHPAEVREIGFVEGDVELTQPFRHLAESSLEGKVVPEALPRPQHTIRSTEVDEASGALTG